MPRGQNKFCLYPCPEKLAYFGVTEKKEWVGGDSSLTSPWLKLFLNNYRLGLIYVHKYSVPVA